MTGVSKKVLDKIFEQIESAFGVSDDPRQIPVCRESFDRLQYLHPASVQYRVAENGDVVGSVSGFPTTTVLAEQFLRGDITEREMFDRTPRQKVPEAFYLMSAYIAPHYRRKGYGRGMAIGMVDAIRTENPEVVFFSWPFSREGKDGLRALEQYLNKAIRRRKRE